MSALNGAPVLSTGKDHHPIAVNLKDLYREITVRGGLEEVLTTTAWKEIQRSETNRRRAQRNRGLGDVRRAVLVAHCAIFLMRDSAACSSIRSRMHIQSRHRLLPSKPSAASFFCACRSCRILFEIFSSQLCFAHSSLHNSIVNPARSLPIAIASHRSHAHLSSHAKI